MADGGGGGGAAGGGGAGGGGDGSGGDGSSQNMKPGCGVNSVTCATVNFAFRKPTVAKVAAKRFVRHVFVVESLTEVEERFKEMMELDEGKEYGTQHSAVQVNLDTIQKKATHELYAVLCMCSSERQDVLDPSGAVLNNTARSFLKENPPHRASGDLASFSPSLASRIWMFLQSMFVTEVPEPPDDPSPDSKLLQQFVALYGDTYMNSVTYGRWILMILQFHLDSLEQQRKLQLELKGIGGYLGGGAAFAPKLSRTLLDVDYTVHMYSGGVIPPAVPTVKDLNFVLSLFESFTFSKSESEAVQISWSSKPYFSAAVNEEATGVTSGARIDFIFGKALPFDPEIVMNLTHLHLRSNFAARISERIGLVEAFVNMHLRSLQLPQVDVQMLESLTGVAQDAHMSVERDPDGMIVIRHQIAYLDSDNLNWRLKPYHFCILRLKELAEGIDKLRNDLADSLSRVRLVYQVVERLNRFIEKDLLPLQTLLQQMFLEKQRLLFLPIRRIENELIQSKRRPKNQKASAGGDAVRVFDLSVPDKTDKLFFRIVTERPEDANRFPLSLKKHVYREQAAILAYFRSLGADEPSFCSRYRRKSTTLLEGLDSEECIYVTENLSDLYFTRQDSRDARNISVDVFAHCQLFNPRKKMQLPPMFDMQKTREDIAQLVRGQPLYL